MNVEYTGRQYVVTSAIRKEVETGLAKIRKILGDRKPKSPSAPAMARWSAWLRPRT